jgi:hypothetical protein
MKVLFLDFDGVLASEQQIRKDKRDGIDNEAKGLTCLDICPMAKSNFQYIFERAPNLKIVVHSTRRSRFSLDEFAEATGVARDAFIGITDPKYYDRFTAISTWLKLNPQVTHYVILEDGPMPGDLSHVIQTDPTNGLTLTDAKRAVTVLDEENDPHLYLF